MNVAHNIIKEHFESLNIVESVTETIELPNKYGNNVSYFSVKFNYIDQWNFTSQDFNIQWDKKVIFIRCEDYFNFKTHKDIINKVSEYLK